MIREVDYATYAVDHRDNLRIISFNDYFTKLTGFTAQDVYAGKMTLRDLHGALPHVRQRGGGFEAHQQNRLRRRAVPDHAGVEERAGGDGAGDHPDL